MTGDETQPDVVDIWCDRCARRIGELDEGITQAEAKKLAQDLYAFERTRAMGPIDAAEFVAVEMSRPDRGPFERRAVPRSGSGSGRRTGPGDSPGQASSGWGSMASAPQRTLLPSWPSSMVKRSMRLPARVTWRAKPLHEHSARPGPVGPTSARHDPWTQP